MKYKKFKCEKLCRDKTIENVQNDGGFCEFIILNEIEYKKSLYEKTIEEAIEVKQSKTKEELILELADVLEVIECITNEYKIDYNEILIAKQKKIKERGSFKERKFIKTVTCPENCEFTKYYEMNKHKYEEIK